MMAVSADAPICQSQWIVGVLLGFHPLLPVPVPDADPVLLAEPVPVPHAVDVAVPAPVLDPDPVPVPVPDVVRVPVVVCVVDAVPPLAGAWSASGASTTVAGSALVVPVSRDGELVELQAASRTARRQSEAVLIGVSGPMIRRKQFDDSDSGCPVPRRIHHG
jgi:hypothetical protein